jgi:hypothetical protein
MTLGRRGEIGAPRLIVSRPCVPHRLYNVNRDAPCLRQMFVAYAVLGIPPEQRQEFANRKCHATIGTPEAGFKMPHVEFQMRGVWNRLPRTQT